MEPDESDAPQLENAPGRVSGQAVERAQKEVGKNSGAPAGLASGLSDISMEPICDGSAADVLAQMHTRFRDQVEGRTAPCVMQPRIEGSGAKRDEG